MNADPIVSFHNSETNVTAFVFVNTAREGGYNVVLRDDDSGDFVPFAKCGIASFEDAQATARIWAEHTFAG